MMHAASVCNAHIGAAGGTTASFGSVSSITLHTPAIICMPTFSPPCSDVITGSTAAPAALLCQEAVDASQGRLLHQPQLQPPLAANIAAIAQSRFGWEGVLDVKLPAGVKLLSISGPVAKNQPLPQAAYASGSTQMPVTLLLPPGVAAAAAAVSKAAADSAASGAPAAGSNSASPAAAAAAVPGPDAAVVNLPGGGSSGNAGPMQWSADAVSVPVLSTCMRFVAALELSRDWPAGSSFEVQVVCEWTAVDGRRVRQVSSGGSQLPPIKCIGIG